MNDLFGISTTYEPTRQCVTTTNANLMVTFRHANEDKARLSVRISVKGRKEYISLLIN